MDNFVTSLLGLHVLSEIDFVYNSGNRYDFLRSDLKNDRFEVRVDPGDIVDVTRYGVGLTIEMKSDALYNEYINELYFTISDFSSFDTVTWKLDVNKEFKEMNDKKMIIGLILIAIVLVGCTPSEISIADTNTPIPTKTNTSVLPTNTPTITPTATSTLTPAPTPTPIGGSSNPILAVSMDTEEEGQQTYIFIIELFSEREIARIPINEPGETLSLSPDGEYLAYVDDKGDEQGIYLHHLISGETKLIYPQADETYIYKIRWSPDQKWLAFEIEVGRRDELWVLDVSSGASRYISSGYDIEWIGPGELYYQSYEARYRLILSTGSSETLRNQRFNFSSIEALIDDDLYNMGIIYLPEFMTSLMEGTNMKDPENPIHFVIRRDIDEPPGLHLASFKTETDLRIWDLLLSPDGETWVICFQEGENIRGGDGDGFFGGLFFTNWAKQEDLPITRDSFTVENFEPLIFAPDGNSILGLRHNPSSSRSFPILGIEVVDFPSGNTLYFHEFGFYEELFPRIRLSDHKPRSFDIVWTPEQVDLSSVCYVPDTPTPTATLDPSIPTPVANQPLLDNIDGLDVLKEADMSKNVSPRWNTSDIEVQEDQSVMVTGTGSWDGYLDYIYNLDTNHGVLAMFNYDEEANGILALTRGDWDTSSYRQWGTMINNSGSQPLISYGSDHFTQAEVIQDLELSDGVWYYIFLGVYDNQLVQIIWNPLNPLAYNLSFYDFEDTDDASYNFHLAVNQGNFYISEITVYTFDGFVDR